MATINVKDAGDVTVAIEKPLAPSRASSALSRPVVLSNEDKEALDLVSTKLDTIDGRVDGLETLITSTNTKLDTAITALQIIDNGAIATINGVAPAFGSGANGATVLRTALATDSPGIIATVAHDAPDSGDPLKIGGKAANAEPAAVANNDRANFISDLVGKQIVLPYANPENFVSGAITSAMTGTTSTSLVAAPAAGLRNYITTIIVSNAHATVGTDVVIQDGSGGTTLLTIPAAAVYGGAVINLPVPLRQPTTATALFCANVTTGASTKVSAVGYKGV